VDDFSAKMAEVLQNPEMMAQIRGLASLLGNRAPEPSEPPPPPEMPQGAMPDIGRILSQLRPTLGRLQTETDETRLLLALRPLLSAERQVKLDRAVRLMKLMRLLPMLKNVLPNDWL